MFIYMPQWRIKGRGLCQRGGGARRPLKVLTGVLKVMLACFCQISIKNNALNESRAGIK